MRLTHFKGHFSISNYLLSIYYTLGIMQMMSKTLNLPLKKRVVQ